MRSVLDRLKHEEVRLDQPRCETLLRTVYEGTYTHSPPRCYASPWIDHCMCVVKIVFHATIPSNGIKSQVYA